MLIVHGGGPAVGAVEIPPDWQPDAELIQSAVEGNMSLILVTEEQLGEAGLQGLFLRQGKEILDALVDFANDPELAEKKYGRQDPTQN